MCGLWNATSLATRRGTSPSAAHSSASRSTSPAAPEITVDEGLAAIAATTCARPSRRLAASANGRLIMSIAPWPDKRW